MGDRVLVTGSDGYIGSVLCRKLQEQGYEVIGLDTGYYRESYLYTPLWDLPRTITKDVRHVTVGDLEGFDAVISLTDLTDPSSQAYPEVTGKTNFDGPATLAEMSKRAGVKRFVYSSSASVYGLSPQGMLDEQSPVNPLTPYAECKLRMEERLGELGDDSFVVSSLRNATVYGLSPRIRFDLVINYLCGTAVARNVIELTSDGGAWRPFVHIDDVSDAFISVLELPVGSAAGLVVNVGNGEIGNHRVIDVAHLIQELTGCEITLNKHNRDRRSYQVDSSRLENLGIKCGRDLRGEVTAMLEFFQWAGLSENELSNKSFNRLHQLQHLLNTGQIDHDLFWTR